MMNYARYWIDVLQCLAKGSKAYYAWVAMLVLLIGSGLVGYSHQLSDGLIVTNLSDQVSWGAYIANFTYLVGIAAAAVLIVVPTYLYHRSDLKKVVLYAELMAASAILMCLMFVTVDLGHPERAFHMLPGIGRLNFPRSILAWDVIVISGYLLLNLHIPGYLLYKKYRGETPGKRYYYPLVILSVGWAVSIHTVTAFLYSGFGGRPFWNSAILAPRFLVSAFASGPSLLILVFMALRKFSSADIEDSVFRYLRNVAMFALMANFFLYGCEVFKEFYTDSTHALSMEYLFFGIHGHTTLVPYIWGGLVLNIAALTVFAVPKLHQKANVLAAGAAACVVGVWVEKGMGLVVPGFIPTPTGDLVEYAPSFIEFIVSVGIWAAGALVFTLFAKVVVAVQSGRMGRAAESGA